jgi:hypothetical protein
MTAITKLPDAEFEIMRAGWDSVPPVSTGFITEKVGKERHCTAAGRLTDNDIAELKRVIGEGHLESKIALYNAKCNFD